MPLVASTGAESPRTTPDPSSSSAAINPDVRGRFASNDIRYREGDHPAQTQFTPDYVLEPVRVDLGGVIGLDPCTTEDNPVGAERFYTAKDDGLSQRWDTETIFVNPPYSKAREPWVDRCIRAAAQGAKVVLLIPAATDTRIFQKATATADSVVFIKGRVKFGVLRPNRRQVAASHPSALIGWNTALEASAVLGWRVPACGEPSLADAALAGTTDSY